MSAARIIVGDALDVLRTMPDESVNCIVTSPPYWGLRDYGVDGQIGREETFPEFLDRLVAVFRECRRVLRTDGVAWVNMGDSYANSSLPYAGLGVKPKDLVGQPWRLAFALQDDGWYLRQDIIWHKPDPMPESIIDRCTKSHEYLFLLSKSARYWWDKEAMQEPAVKAGQNRVLGPKSFSKGQAIGAGRPLSGNAKADSVLIKEYRNRRSVWSISTEPYRDAHFATYPTALVRPCILAGCPAGGTVLDPFSGSGTTVAVAIDLGRNGIGIELNPEYAAMSERRLIGVTAGLPLEAA